MLKKITYLFFISAFVFLLSASFTFAISENNNPLPRDQKNDRVEATTPSVKDFKQESQDIKDQVGQSIEQVREQMKTEITTLRENAKQKMEDLKTKIQSVKDKVKAKIQEDRITGREEALSRFDNAISKIEDLKTKVATQVTKMQARGITIPATLNETSLSVDIKILDIKGKIAKSNEILATSTNELSKTQKTELTTLAQDIQTLVKETQKLLNDEVISLKQAFQEKIDADKAASTNK